MTDLEIPGVFLFFPPKSWTKRSTVTKRDQNLRLQKNSTNLIDVPIWLGVLATFCWILLCAALFSAFESWPFSLAFYFTFLVMTTNNLGDVSPTKIDYLLANFSIFFGLCIVSMLVSIIQSNIENFIKRVEGEIDLQFKKRMESEKSDDRKPEEIVKEIIANYGFSWINSLISAERIRNLVETAAEKAAMELKECQTDPVVILNPNEPKKILKSTKNMQAQLIPKLTKSPTFILIDIFPSENLEMGVETEVPKGFDEQSECDIQRLIPANDFECQYLPNLKNELSQTLEKELWRS